MGNSFLTTNPSRRIVLMDGTSLFGLAFLGEVPFSVEDFWKGYKVSGTGASVSSHHPHPSGTRLESSRSYLLSCVYSLPFDVSSSWAVRLFLAWRLRKFGARPVLSIHYDTETF